ncbi:MAG: tRNA glutamyl-Q(34) synthetase GluQRS [Bacteroides sp.]|nr:tRNA glutamyl-Q(34) synthetase GluQRS [Bacteroides sp.]
MTLTPAPNTPSRPVVGRFAPSPSGRMHLGNIFTAVISWLDARSSGGRWILRIEDLDPQRSKTVHARAIEDDLRWLGLDWDEGGLDNLGQNPPYCQSLASDIYTRALRRITDTGLAYPCRCTRADLNATNAPHSSDGRIIYPGTCRPASRPTPFTPPPFPHAVRLCVPDSLITFTDIVFGPVSSNLAHDCGDFVLRRADLAWAYQLAVVVDDARMHVSRVVRGADLLLSTAQQLYLYSLLDLAAPSFAHLPLICNSAGRRLSKRDADLSMQTLRDNFTPAQIITIVARLAGLIPPAGPLVTLPELLRTFSWTAIPRTHTIRLPDDLKTFL